MHRTAPPSLVIGSLLMMMAIESHALGFGRADGQHLLGQALSFSIPLHVEADENLGPECATAEVLAGDQRVAPENVQAFITPGNDAGERVLRIVTRTSIDEPVVTVSASVGCPTRLTRRFVLFLDPPIVQVPSPTAASESPAAIASQPAAPVTPTPSPRAQGPASEAPAAPRTTRARRSAAAVAAASAPVRSSVQARERSRAAARAASSAASAVARPRLQLEPLEPMVGAPVAAASASGSAPTSAPPAAASAVPMPAEGDARVRALEESLAALKSQSKAAQDSLAQMQARLREAEAARYDRPIVYGLAALVALLVVLLGLLMRQRSREREARWWAAAEQAGAAPAPQAPTPAPPQGAASAMGDEETGPAPFTTSGGARMPVTQPVPMPESRREVTVEELIDLEQQAEFFLVLGQDEAAIDLLMGHLRSTGGISPLPYLKLLEIYRRRNERDAYERIRERFNHRFNAYAPDWDSDFAQGRSLESYPEVIARLQMLWKSPPLAMAELESLLFRQAQDGVPFDLPAYREVLFLYSLARDLLQDDSVAAGVDLLLPIDDEGTPTATQPLSPFPDASPGELHIDLDLGNEPADEGGKKA